MKSKFNYQVLLSKVARNQYKLHNLKQEWKVFILFVFLAKMLTWSISIFAGTNYFTQLLFPVLQHKAFTIGVAVLVLLVIEVLTTIALSKFFKFLLRGSNHVSTVTALAFVVLALFGISFVSSTNGLAMRQANKVDDTENIVKRMKLKQKQLKNEYNGRFADIDKQIRLIENNPQGWSGGKRTILLKAQSNKIDSLLVVKSNLLQQQKTDMQSIGLQKRQALKGNKQETTAEADKYYKIVMVVMIVQFISSGMLMFFWKRILNEDDEMLLQMEEIDERADIVFTNFVELINNRINAKFNKITERMAVIDESQINIAIDQTKEQTDSYKTAQKIGFKNKNDQSQKPVAKNTGPSKRLDGSAGLRPVDLHKKNIEFLTRHKAIVKGIKLVKLAEKESIANSEIKQVQAVVKRAKHKGRTLIREVYKVAVTVGLNKIDDNGNINF